MSGAWERRWHPLLQQWVLIAGNSAVRPWSGAMATVSATELPSHDPDCYLCPGVTRANGSQNPDYTGPYAFDNDFPSLSFDAPHPEASSHDSVLHRTAAAHGCCRVLCWSERHDMTLASLTIDQIHQVARLWRNEYQTLSAHDDIAMVNIFENKGTEIGVSNLHPHGQIYATSFVTDAGSRFRDAQWRYWQDNNRASLLQDLLSCSPVQDKLTVDVGRHWTVMVPYAARFSYETWVVPHRHVSSLCGLSDPELDELAELYQRQVRRYDLLFQRSAPNITLLHNAPCDTHVGNDAWCFHIAFQPPLRDPQKMKFLAGFEAGSNNIVNPLQPEKAAEQLRGIDTNLWG